MRSDRTVLYSLEYDAGENNDILMLLKKLGIFDGEYASLQNMTYGKAAKIFGESFSGGDLPLTNEDFMCLCAKSFALSEKNGEKLFDFYDFSLVKAENRTLVASYLESFSQYENTDGKHLLRPKNVLSEEEFFKKLKNFEKELAKKYGFDVTAAKVTDFSMTGNEKTLCLTNGDEIKIKEGDLLLFTGDKTVKGSSVTVFSKDNTAYAAESKSPAESRYKTGGIYKGSVFLYDRSGQRIIFKNLKRYQKGEFLNASDEGTLSGFDAFSNFLVFENYYPSSSDKINSFLLDKEAVFFTMIDGYGNEKICYIIYVE